MSFENVYADPLRAQAYAQLQFPGTYYLAFRDLPRMISEFVTGTRALDFGCGTGRSTRFLKQLGLDARGIDISENMVRAAREFDPAGDYQVTPDNGHVDLPAASFDLILSAFTFDNIPTAEKKIKLFTDLGKLLRKDGVILNLVSSPDIYTHEWASFTTRNFPENHTAKSGDRVRIVMTDVEDRRPVEDILWTDESYREVYARAGLQVVTMHKPLATVNEAGEDWVNETRVAPWVVWVVRQLQ